MTPGVYHDAMSTTRLKQILEARGMSQGELARRAGKDKGYISKLARGACRPSVDNAAEIAEVLGTTIEELFELVDEPAPKEGAIAS
jgi:transcriptional regulator with XRE-family HTH domain